MAKITVSSGSSQSTSKGKSESTSQKTLDTKLQSSIMAGLMGYMTDEEMDAYAKNLLAPTLKAQKEAAQQQYESAKLTGEQELGSLADSLARDIGAQKGAYTQSMADVQNAALARGMGRSSYALEAMAGQGALLNQAIERLTRESGEKEAAVRERMALAQKQSAQTQARLDSDYAAQLAAKVQEIKNAQRQQYNQNYLAALQASMGQTTSSRSETSANGKTDSVGAQEDVHEKVVTADMLARLQKTK